ncbi:unnamed protein product [Hermetia illucens]|uniref:Uncharacterized protein n=1 Tax=Hermetia illucens TaxID=343691 RepID=A0A7R8V8Q2_HERIL|nr:unnamed protein product [Hermetia illucens]
MLYLHKQTPMHFMKRTHILNCTRFSFIKPPIYGKTTSNSHPKRWSHVVSRKFLSLDYYCENTHPPTDRAATNRPTGLT